MTRNIALWPWFRFFRSLMFWQAVWFLYIQGQLSAAEAILIYALYDISTTVLEVPSGWLSDRWGRRPTLILSALAGVATAGMQALGGDFWWFALAQILLGAHAAFASGTDSSLLYESLVDLDREDEVERQEMIGWRAGFAGLAISALAGGAMARWDLTWPYVATTVAMVALLAVTIALREPPRRTAPDRAAVLATLGAALRRPILIWLFILSMLMYGLSHVPFVFGQPFIERALAGGPLASETPLISGAITAAMMALSLLVSLVAPRLRAHVGLIAMLLGAMAMQVALPGALAIATGPLAVLLLLARMVPDALAKPFITARIQPLLSDDSRATYLSLQSLAGRVLFAATLWLAASSTSDIGLMPDSDLRQLLSAYAIGGALCLLGLILAARHLRLD
ncbi:MFS transporter [Jannaschia sp. M317]|uniref:MFS transporter n=1 Tax=Jannaschia sp. M317 TaxID=2867011 RepID=UPI0021A71DED|nr:MFS transporter [Jannaschia sp. M317]UWQ18140.1 MFS transporter [Jannaschia sp. M317]